MLREVRAHRRDLLGGWQLALVRDEPLHEVARIVDAGNAHEVGDDVVGDGIAAPPHPVEVLVRERRSGHGPIEHERGVAPTPVPPTSAVRPRTARPWPVGRGTR